MNGARGIIRDRSKNGALIRIEDFEGVVIYDLSSVRENAMNTFRYHLRVRPRPGAVPLKYLVLSGLKGEPLQSRFEKLKLIFSIPGPDLLTEV